MKKIGYCCLFMLRIEIESIEEKKGFLLNNSFYTHAKRNILPDQAKARVSDLSIYLTRVLAFYVTIAFRYFYFDEKVSILSKFQ